MSENTQTTPVNPKNTDPTARLQWTPPPGLIPQESTFNPDIHEAICQAIESGTSVRSACQMFDLPTATFYCWTDKQGLAGRYARVRANLAHQLISKAHNAGDRLIEFEDNVPADPKLANAWVNAQKSGAEILERIAKRLLPEEYGDVQTNINRNETMIYAVLFDPSNSPGDQQAVSLPGKHEPKQIAGKVIGKADTKPRKHRGKKGSKLST